MKKTEEKKPKKTKTKKIKNKKEKDNTIALSDKQKVVKEIKTGWWDQ